MSEEIKLEIPENLAVLEDLYGEQFTILVPEGCTAEQCACWFSQKMNDMWKVVEDDEGTPGTVQLEATESGSEDIDLC